MKPKQHYNPNTGEWDGQLPLPPPTLDGTLLSLSKWAARLPISAGGYRMLMTIIGHVDWTTGAGCRASIDTLAEESASGRRQAMTRIKELVDAGIINRQRRLQGPTETTLIRGVSLVQYPALTDVQSQIPGTREEEDTYTEYEITSSSPVLVRETAPPDVQKTAQVDCCPSEPDPGFIRAELARYPGWLASWRAGPEFAVRFYLTDWNRFLSDRQRHQDKAEMAVAVREVRAKSRQRR